ncbi:hypothetical protein [Sulfuricurvum sp.]|uniref:hypothetical protein n=1 Tax=Sulfuricurvum sp. TaxID=2025608 RepID=UPI0026352B3B|nr:hypothetical protein [Sulfuricurvum sp.]MDD2267049.1 hypothetical protein [Sulfuricurvum sp.]MDD2784946.1 hypothetical protein [Sulfuricurvum sp.]
MRESLVFHFQSNTSFLHSRAVLRKYPLHLRKLPRKYQYTHINQSTVLTAFMARIRV